MLIFRDLTLNTILNKWAAIRYIIDCQELKAQH
jgi:hypothetical protein